jgi:hypothetical protein
MEFQKSMNLSLTSFASVVFGVSASILLSNSFFSYQSFPYLFDLRMWSILAEALFAYLVGFVVILDIDGYLNRSNGYSSEIGGKKELALLLAVCIVILVVFIGVLGSSFKYLSMLSYATYTLAFGFFVVTERKKTRFMMFVFFVGGSFLLLPLPILSLTTGLTHLDEISNLKAIEYEDGVHFEMDTVLCQENGDAVNICAEMILLEDSVEDNAECIKILKYLKKDCKRELHWSITLDAQNEYVLYLFIRSSLGENEYSKILIKKDDEGWKASCRKLKSLEYSRAYWHERLKKVLQTLEAILGIFEDH